MRITESMYRKVVGIVSNLIPFLFRSLSTRIDELLGEGYDWGNKDFPLSAGDINRLLQNELKSYFPKQIIRNLACEVIIDISSALTEMDGLYVFNTEYLQKRGDWKGGSDDVRSLANMISILECELSAHLKKREDVDNVIKETFTFNLYIK